jgi:hypothetical protein
VIFGKCKNQKLSLCGREKKRVAHASEPPVVIPIIVVAVDVHVALVVIPLVERGEYV